MPQLTELELLDHIDPSQLDYSEWISVGMCIKDSGGTASQWDSWSRRDSKRYHEGECFTKWDSFKGSSHPVTAGTLVALAKDQGWQPECRESDPGMELSWDAIIGPKDELVVVEQGDSLVLLKTLPDKSVHCCITSPPYWGLRDYGVDGQMGLEKTPEEYVAKMVELFREVRRVLRDDGTLWLNLGDSYVGGGKKGDTEGSKQKTSKGATWGGNDNLATHKANVSGLKSKDLVGIPWRVAFALQADGWYLRSDIIWHKPNPMPESVTDRPTKAHEYIFLLAKSQRYYYDHDAIKEPSVTSWFYGQERRLQRVQASGGALSGGTGEKESNGTDRNKRTVWTVATAPYKEAHFATFPPKLIEPCILAGTSPQACEVCGAPWEREIETLVRAGHKSRLDEKHFKCGSGEHKSSIKKQNGWQPTCKCQNNGNGKCVVLDPFSGAGTTGMVALRHGRRYIGIELNPAYVEMSKGRIAGDAPLFNRGIQSCN